MRKGCSMAEHKNEKLYDMSIVKRKTKKEQGKDKREGEKEWHNKNSFTMPILVGVNANQEKEMS